MANLTYDDFFDIVNASEVVPKGSTWIIPSVDGHLFTPEPIELNGYPNNDQEIPRLIQYFDELQDNYNRVCGNTSQDCDNMPFRAVLEGLMRFYDKLYPECFRVLILPDLSGSMRKTLPGRDAEGRGLPLGTEVKRVLTALKGAKYILFDSHTGYKYGRDGWIDINVCDSQNRLIDISDNGFFQMEQSVFNSVEVVRKRGWLPDDSLGEYTLRVNRGSARFDEISDIIKTLLPTVRARSDRRSGVKVLSQACGDLYHFFMDNSCVLPGLPTRSKSDEAREQVVLLLNIGGWLNAHGELEQFKGQIR